MRNLQTAFTASQVLFGLRVLVVEDSDEVRMLLANYLQAQGCRVYIAQDGRDGLTKVAQVNPDLILMDIGMPYCDGLTVCRILQSNPSTQHIPVIFLTGATSPRDRVNGLLAGAVDYVTKPFDFDEVRLRLIVHFRVRQKSALATFEVAEESVGETVAPVQPSSKASNLDTILFQSARLHLLRHLERTHDLQALAGLINTNPKRLNEAFRNCVGMTVFDFLREERMRKGRELLKETAMEVQTIAKELGFTSGGNFATAFKERFGLSPRDYRVAMATARPLGWQARPLRAPQTPAPDVA